MSVCLILLVSIQNFNLKDNLYPSNPLSEISESSTINDHDATTSNI
jgi:hypothetical protein